MAAEVSTVDAVAIPTHYIGSHRYVYSDCPCGREAVVTSATGSRASVVRVRSWRVGAARANGALRYPPDRPCTPRTAPATTDGRRCRRCRRSNSYFMVAPDHARLPRLLVCLCRCAAFHSVPHSRSMREQRIEAGVASVVSIPVVGLVVSAVFTPVLVAFHRLECRRSEEHTSELQSLMRTSYAVFCLKK